MFKQIPNILTTVRIILIPVLVIVLYFENQIMRYIAAGIFIAASITDCLDGLMARMYKLQTNFGRMLDPIADKMLITSTLLLLVNKHMVPIVPTVAILCREIFVSGMRVYLAEIKIRLPVSFISKIKTLLQMFSIAIILLGEDGSGIPNAEKIGSISLWVTAALTVISGYVYFKEVYKHM